MFYIICEAICYCIHAVAAHVLGHRFTAETDHRSLVYMATAEAPKIVTSTIALTREAAYNWKSMRAAPCWHAVKAGGKRGMGRRGTSTTMAS
jgi:hypothetical protein